MENFEQAPSTPYGHRPPTVQVVRIDPGNSAPVRTVAPIAGSRRFDQAKVHGAHAALTFVADETRAGEPTVTIECASRTGNDDRTYAWNDKLRFQLTATELQLFACLLLGSVGELSFRNHGDKWCHIVRQSIGKYAGSIRMTLGQNNAGQTAPRTVAIDYTGLGPVAALCLRQCANLLRLAVEAVPTVLRAVSRAYTESEASRPATHPNRMSREDGGATTPESSTRRLIEPLQNRS